MALAIVKVQIPDWRAVCPSRMLYSRLKTQAVLTLTHITLRLCPPIDDPVQRIQRKRSLSLAGHWVRMGE